MKMSDIMQKKIDHSYAASIKSELGSLLGKKKLEQVLHVFLDSKIFDKKSVEALELLLSGGSSPDEYLKLLKAYDKSPVCGLVWNANFFAYRCRDCGISPCMSLCADCFLAGDHEGHDFNMFKSQAGGACDCGDETVMKKEGFCHHHKQLEFGSEKNVPEDLTVMPKFILPKLIVSLYERLEAHLNSDNESDVMANALFTSEHLLTVLYKFAAIDVSRDIICEKVLSPIENLKPSECNIEHTNNVSSLVSCDASNGRKIVRTSSEQSWSIEVAVGKTVDLNHGPHKPLEFTEEQEQISAWSRSVNENRRLTYIQFFMDVLVKTEFPNSLSTFLLQLLPNCNYKDAFSRLFCRQYTAIGKSLSLSQSPDALSNHIVHVSVQLFSNETLALKMVREENLLFKMIFVLSKMIGECLDNYSIEIEGQETSIMVVNCDHKILSGHCYWPIASDLTNILSHQSVAKIFLETGDCLNRWMHFVNMLTGININKRRFFTPAEYEARTYYTAFSIEFESVAAVMWELYRAITKLNEKAYVLKMIEVSSAALKDWYSFVPNKLNKSSFTFHLPLHRYFSLFISQAVNSFNEDISKFLPSDILLDSLDHVVHCVAALHEIRAGLWVYNGNQIRCQAQSYLQSYFCNSMLDLDLFFLQLILCVIDPDVFLDKLLDRFFIASWFQFGDTAQAATNVDDDKTLTLIEGFLNMILMILTHRVYSGLSDLDILRKDIVTYLCVADKAHSQLVEVIPTRPGDAHSPGKRFEKVLEEVAYYRSPTAETSSLQQGMFTPKDSTWSTDYDYIHVYLRIYKKSDQQAAQERYNAVIVKNKLSTTSTTWPPLRSLAPIHPAFNGVFRLLQSKKLHKILTFMIYKFVESSNGISERIITSAIHLLQLCLEHMNDDCGTSKLTKSNRDDNLIDLVNKYLDAVDNKKDTNIFRNLIKEELKKDIDFKILVEKMGEDDDVTFLIQMKFHQPLFKELLTYVDTAISEITFSLVYMSKHLKTLLKQLPHSKFVLLKRLIQHWHRYCRLQNIGVEALPFIKKHGEGFDVLMAMLMKYYDYFFEVCSTAPGFPGDVFQIKFFHNNIAENAHVVFNEVATTRKMSLESVPVESIDEALANQFVEITNCERRTAVEFLTEYNKDLQLALTMYLNQQSACHNETTDHTERKNCEATVIGPMQSSACCLKEDTCSLCASNSSRISLENDYCLLTLLIRLRNMLMHSSEASPLKNKQTATKITAGNGVYYITKLLKLFYEKSKANARILEQLCPGAVPDTCDVVMKEKIKELSPQEQYRRERRKKAIERQKEMLSEFATKQKKFLENLEQDAPMDVGEDETSSSFQLSSLQFKCVICGQKTESTENNPIGVIVFLQPSTVLAKRYTDRSSGNNVMFDELLNERKKALLAKFDSFNVRSAFECGIDCGINIQSCGHYLHVECHQSYFKTLQEDPQRLINTDNGEFSCPLCRQLSNAVMAILPSKLRQNYKNVGKISNTFTTECKEIDYFLTNSQTGGISYYASRALEFSVLTASLSSLTHTVKDLIKSCNKSTVTFYGGDKWMSADQFFVILATLRQNLESEFVNIKNTGNLPSLSQRNCMKNVLEGFHFHVQCISSPLLLRWKRLCYGINETVDGAIPLRRNKSLEFYDEMPLLLVDSTSLLLQLFLTWPRRILPGELRILIQLLYNLTFTQAVCLIGSKLQAEEKQSWYQNCEQNTDFGNDLMSLASTIWKYSSFLESYELMSTEIGITQSVVSLHTVEIQVQELCLPFLQFSVVLLYEWLQDFELDASLFNQPLFQQFESLCSLCQLGIKREAKTRVSLSSNSSSSYLVWYSNSPINVIRFWCDEISTHPNLKDCQNPRALIPILSPRQLPKLIDLPQLFDSLFQQYRKQTCKQCNKLPDDPTLCLVCGAFMCFHGNCCRNQDKVNECVEHSIRCGSGTGVFLVISTSVTLVIRDERVCLWGSVYLDKHGEEDRDLRRGKPLFLSADRYSRLEKEWRSHILDYSPGKRWGLHLNRL